MSDVEEYFTQMAGTDADKPDATDDVKHDETMGSGQVTDVAGGLERPSFWTDDMEREFRAEVKSLFDDMVGRQQGELSVRDQCEHAYEELTATVNGKYKELTGKDLPASMARNLDQLLTQITMAPLNEPEHGPGLWAKLPQHSIATMVEARPLDLTGSPTRMDIDLMMLHTIRMGRFLTTHYTDWAQTLPPCWIRPNATWTWSSPAPTEDCTHRRCSRSSIPRWNASKRISPRPKLRTPTIGITCPDRRNANGSRPGRMSTSIGSTVTADGARNQDLTSHGGSPPRRKAWTRSAT